MNALRLFARLILLVYLPISLLVLMGDPAQANNSIDTKSNSHFSAEGFINPDGTLRLDGSFNGSIDLQGWDVQLDPQRGPVFAPANHDLLASSAPPGNWVGLGSNGNGDGSLNLRVWAVAVNGSDVYVGGWFTDVNNHGTILTAADYIAKWDGENWSALGSNGAGNGSLDLYVRDIVVSGNDIYVGGAFNNVNNNGTVLNAADLVAKWDGSNWSALGNDGFGDGSIAGNYVSALAMSGGSLFVGGRYLYINNYGTALYNADSIGKWDGNNWSALGSDGSGGGSLNGEVRAIAVSGNDVYVGGEFTDVNNNGTILNNADHIAKWDGANWSALGGNGSGDGSLNWSVNAIAVSESAIYVGGAFSDVNNGGAVLTAADYIAKWDGVNWSALGSDGSGNGSLNSEVYSIIIVSGSDVYVGGLFLHVNNNGIELGAGDNIAKWDGTNWSALGSDGAGGGSINWQPVHDIAINGSDLYAGGDFTNVNNDGTVLNNADFIADYGISPGTPTPTSTPTSTATATLTHTPIPNGSTIRVSVDSAGSEADGMNEAPVISANGRFVAFCSIAPNLVNSDTNNKWDVFVHDTLTGATTRVSVDSAGNQGNGNSGCHLGLANFSGPGPAISADGRFVAFGSDATNLVSNDTNALTDIFVHDRLTGITTRVSVDGSGNQANGPSANSTSGNRAPPAPTISGDGRYVAFVSRASNLVSGDNNDKPDIFVHDRQTVSTIRAFNDVAETQGYGFSDYPAISNDGRFIAFSCSCGTAAGGGLGGGVFVYDLQTGAKEPIQVEPGSVSSEYPYLSADGRYVAFVSHVNDLVLGDTNNVPDIFVYDRVTETYERMSVDSAGNQGNSDSMANSSRGPVISADGRFVAFFSRANNLVPNDTNDDWDIFVRDRQMGITERVSVGNASNEANSFSVFPGISEDGRFVVFWSGANNLVSGDTNNSWDIFLRDRVAPLVTETPTSTPTSTPTNTATNTVTSTSTRTPTSTPSNTPTSTQTPITTPNELIKNGGFNTYTGTSKIPTNWNAVNFSTTDGKTTTVKKEGAASVRIIGTGVSKTLKQTLLLNGSTGDAFTFSFWVKGSAIPTAGVCRAQILFYNGATLNPTKKTVNCGNGTYGFKQKLLSFTAPGPYTKIVVRFTYSKASGRVWFDWVSLVR